MRSFDVQEVIEFQEAPLSDEVRMVPELPTETYDLVVVVSTIKEVIVSVLLAFPAASVTIIVQSEYVPSLKVRKVMVLFPEIADAIPDEHEPP